ncbi:hypothetical protein J5N97_018358 [Dioscorea zingiberensis]|uniref:Uncharacterized protein n=1 Tax=Dioscorea zingiberensis TaxID=325984 RepID=A0A9D5CMR6_9LILI|nr:hypothetical protein J5N97_018358 [Dioscorea zingiberensis]
MRGFPSSRLRSSLSKKLAAKDSIASAPIGKSPPDSSKKSQPLRVSKASGTIPESKSLFLDKTHQKSLTLIDPDRICSILSQKDWFLTLNSEFKPIAVHLGYQSVVSVLQKQENPIFSLKFYVWVSNLDVKAMDQSELKHNLIGLDIGEEFQIMKDLKVKTFRSHHVIPSQVTYTVTSPEIAFTGDPTSDFVVDP